MTDPRAIDALYHAARTGQLAADEIELAEGVDAGLQAQLAVLERLEADGERVGGWKLGFTSGRGRDLLGPGVRPFGYVLASRRFRSGDAVAHHRITTAQVEPELAVVLGTGLSGADVDAASAKAAVAQVCPAFEINEMRAPRGTPLPVVVADDLAQWGVVVGDGIAPPERDLRSTTVEVRCNGEVVATTTPGDSMDDPFASLARLAQELSRFGRSLHPGDVVITGAFSIHPVPEPSRWQAAFSDLGLVEIAFTR
jgi:2-keto-4-pentenoate hydratase